MSSLDQQLTDIARQKDKLEKFKRNGKNGKNRRKMSEME